MRTVNTILLAAGIGFIAGILLAPDKGTETRRKLKDGAKKLASDLQDRLSGEYLTTLEHRNQQEEYDMLLGL